VHIHHIANLVAHSRPEFFGWNGRRGNLQQHALLKTQHGHCVARAQTLTDESVRKVFGGFGSGLFYAHAQDLEGGAVLGCLNVRQGLPVPGNNELVFSAGTFPGPLHVQALPRMQSKFKSIYSAKSSDVHFLLLA